MRSAAVILLLVLMWTVGLATFAQRVDRSTPPNDPPRADGVVALTGASDARIAEAMRLLEDGKAQRMLISGVNPSASRADIRGVARATRRYYDCCVDLGFQATNTVGNARETARWARQHRFASLIVVTSDFHMPRAMLELKGALPEARLTPYPVRTTELDAHHWWRSETGARRMIVEYDKYLAILFREGLISLGGKARPAPDQPHAAAATVGAPA
ncbi:YdcF family protein [Phenylobacterium montanum]|uniref:YdcF family protein n=1 Tax=Phenylobacterium montanum TaxID=2823693 RepID=A0A975FXS1_9CAUL|nr:YdcF family protein [Caulobacter sp. S6]QUD86919.1 YdcF family protein [Caulobacter sp. S6]